jgi:hypothetical protein
MLMGATINIEGLIGIGTLVPGAYEIDLFT